MLPSKQFECVDRTLTDTLIIGGNAMNNKTAHGVELVDGKLTHGKDVGR